MQKLYYTNINAEVLDQDKEIKDIILLTNFLFVQAKLLLPVNKWQDLMLYHSRK